MQSLTSFRTDERKLSSKLSFESFIIASKVSVVLVVIETPQIGVFVLRSKWLLPGLALT